jgi:hypothetical protein
MNSKVDKPTGICHLSVLQTDVNWQALAFYVVPVGTTVPSGSSSMLHNSLTP